MIYYLYDTVYTIVCIVYIACAICIRHIWYNKLSIMQESRILLRIQKAIAIEHIYVLFDFYNWTEFLSKYFKPIPNLLKYHHFILHKDNIGKVEVKTAINKEKQTINIIKSNNTKIAGFPQEVFSSGLSAERQWYLYEQVYQHIKDPQKQNEYYLLPTIPKPKKSN